jgi:prophage regulatory protein
MKLLTQQDVGRLTGLSRATIWRYERFGRFPRRLRLGPNRIGWRSDEIEAWIESRPRGTAQPADAV